MQVIDMPYDDAIVKPVKGRKSPELGELAVMVGSERDLFDICELMNAERNDFHRLFNSKLYIIDSGNTSVSFAGPFIGAPYAVMVMETLIAWGVKKILFFGWCGAISRDVKIGDIIVPTSAVIDEGTSKHYADGQDPQAYPSEQIVKKTAATLSSRGIPFHQGMIWTTDAIYRETPGQVAKHQLNGVLGVEMEGSALFTAARFRCVDMGAVMVVSDELFELKWRPGFSESTFKKARRAVSGAMHALCLSL
jgi:uridine phosphorylase